MWAERCNGSCQADAAAPSSRASLGYGAPCEIVVTGGIPPEITDGGAAAVRALFDAFDLHALDPMLSKVEFEGSGVTEATWSYNQREELFRKG